MKPTVALLCLTACFRPACSASAAPAGLNLENAVIVTAGNLSKAESSAVTMLVEEIEKRTLIRPAIRNQWPSDGTPVIALGRAGNAKQWAGTDARLFADGSSGLPAEGYTIRTIPAGGNRGAAVLISGSDARGVLFGAGRLLRELYMTRGRLSLPAEMNLTTAPRYTMRGHQMGYRPKTNSYDAWSEDIWKQYIRDLAVFGTNAVEMIPPRSDDAKDSPHFPLPQIEMMAKVSQILDSYDMDVWIWYPAMEPDYSKPETVKAELQAWGEVFAKMPRLDAIFVPGGDPGHTAPRYMMPFLEKMTAELHRHHPKARMWMSPQSFNSVWMAEFLNIMKEQPGWLSGVVYGPQTRITLPELRAALPRRYPIRRYPDITHSLSCQYPVPDWDLAYAMTEARECINPRPTDEAAIFRAYKDDAAGFISYSEGCNDDVNKIVWSSLGWDPDADVAGILRQYSRYFIGPDYEQSFSQGLLALEHDWRGPLSQNKSVEATLELFRKMEREASPRLLLNWRFQQALYRAYYDAYTRRRLIYETGFERQAMEKLQQASSIGSLQAMQQADALVWTPEKNLTALDLRTRVYQLAEALYQSIRMQLSVPLYRAISVDRGANLDTLDTPLNDRNWLRARFEEIRKLPDEGQRLEAIGGIVHWEDPGPGGFYDDLGDPDAQPHLVQGLPYGEDPAFFRSPVIAFSPRRGWRLSWCRHADALYDNSLKLRYTGLDPQARYKVRVVYSGSLNSQVRLVANDTIQIHPLMAKPNPIRPVEFDLPAEAAGSGELVLSWTSSPGRGGAGRGPQVAEVWLIRK